MPVYEYECNSCLSRFDLRKSFDDSGPVCCPECGGSAQRVFSPVPIIFKGSGFYVTDNRNRGNHGSSSPEGNHDRPEAVSKEEGG